MTKSVSGLLDTQVTPKRALEKRTCRTFKAEYKLCMIAEAEACKPGELGALLRREKLYSNQLSDWRREFAEKGVAGVSKSAPRLEATRTPEQRRIDQLEKENSRLNQKLEMAHDCLDLQKNPCRCSIDSTMGAMIFPHNIGHEVKLPAQRSAGSAVL